MPLISENPFILVVIAGLVTVIMVFMYFQMKDNRLLPCIAVGLLLTILPLVVDATVVTDREAIRATVQRLARSVQQNDVAAALDYAHPDSPGVYNEIKKEMPIYDFTWCTVTGFSNIDVNESGTEARVTFRVWVNVKAKRGPEGIGDREVVLEMRKDSNDDWKIMDYHHYDPRRRDL